jgi:hypothetical protein
MAMQEWMKNGERHERRTLATAHKITMPYARMSGCGGAGLGPPARFGGPLGVTNVVSHYGEEF